MARSSYRTHNQKISKDIADDIAVYINKKVSDFVIDMRESLEQATPKDTTHGAINWLIRKRAGKKEYGKRSYFPAHADRREYNQPTLSDAESGVSIAESFDIRKGAGNLTVFNNVDYITEINEGTHPAQQSNWNGSKATISRLRGEIGFIEKTISRVEGKHGF